MRSGVFGTLVRAYDRLQRLHIGVKTPAIRVRYGLGFATLVIHLIHVVSALFVPEGHLRVMCGRVQIIQHVRHGRDCICGGRIHLLPCRVFACVRVCHALRLTFNV